MMEYVVGFAHDAFGRVALIKKNRPDWQKGFWNGIGGHVEESDHYPLRAIQREVQEEAGVFVEDWKPFVVMTFPQARITFFKALVTVEVLDQFSTMTDEQVMVDYWSIFLRTTPLIPNLRWLVPLALYQEDDYELIQVVASHGE